MSGPRSECRADRDAKHRAAVARSLQWADDAALRADYADALGWVGTVQAVDGEIPDEYKAKRDTWRLALGRRQRAPSAEPATAGATS